MTMSSHDGSTARGATPAPRSMPGGSPRFQVAGHLRQLLADADRLAQIVSDASAVGPSSEAIRATLALDGADVDLLPDVASAAATVANAAAPPNTDGGSPEGASTDGARAGGASADGAGPNSAASSANAVRGGTWLDTLRVLDDPSDPQIRALEVLGVKAAMDASDLATSMLSDTPAAASALHRRLTRGLVGADRAGEPRHIEQAVHDGATGRILYFTPEPADVPTEIAELSEWANDAGAQHPVIVSGVLHHELLRIHPFDAANGRLARAAARLVLTQAGVHADAEPALAADPLGYHEEVARSVRRRDLTIWLERWAEAVVSGLRVAARECGGVDIEVAADDRAFLDAHATFTVADIRTHAGNEADRVTTRLLDAGAVTYCTGSRGLRFKTT